MDHGFYTWAGAVAAASLVLRDKPDFNIEVSLDSHGFSPESRSCILLLYNFPSCFIPFSQNSEETPPSTSVGYLDNTHLWNHSEYSLSDFFQGWSLLEDKTELPPWQSEPFLSELISTSTAAMYHSPSFLSAWEPCWSLSEWHVLHCVVTTARGLRELRLWGEMVWNTHLQSIEPIMTIQSSFDLFQFHQSRPSSLPRCWQILFLREKNDVSAKSCMFDIKRHNAL